MKIILIIFAVALLGVGCTEVDNKTCTYSNGDRYCELKGAKEFAIECIEGGGKVSVEFGASKEGLNVPSCTLPTN